MINKNLLMIKYNIILILCLFIFNNSLSQKFVDDIYYDDSEVNYDFLYIDSKDSDFLDDKTSNDTTHYWDDEISYESRIRKFNDPLYYDTFWDYGWNNHYHNWNHPYSSWSFGLSNYGWGIGYHYGFSPHNSYFGLSSFGWGYSPYYNPYAWGFNNIFYSPYNYNYLNSYVISGNSTNFSFGQRNSTNTNLISKNSQERLGRQNSKLGDYDQNTINNRNRNKNLDLTRNKKHSNKYSNKKNPSRENSNISNKHRNNKSKSNYRNSTYRSSNNNRSINNRSSRSNNRGKRN